MRWMLRYEKSPNDLPSIPQCHPKSKWIMQNSCLKSFKTLVDKVMENPCLKLDEYSKFNLGSAKNYPTKYSSSSPFKMRWDSSRSIFSSGGGNFNYFWHWNSKKCTTLVFALIFVTFRSSLLLTRVDITKKVSNFKLR